MRKTKKFLAIVAAMAMALAPTSVFAAPAASTGNGASDVELEGAVKKDYLDYTAPTVGNNTFDFLLDPQELISSTDGQTLAGDAVVTEAGVTVYFKKGSSYAASSSALEVTNKGTSEITVSVNATMGLDATGSSINVVTNQAAVATGSGLNLRIHLDQVTGGGATAALAPDSAIATKSALSLEATAAAADLDDFEVTKAAVSGGGMEYQYLPKTDDASGGSVAFVFRGECNSSDDADWTAVKGMSATFDVVWNVSSASDETTAYAVWENGATYFSADEDGETTFDGLTAKSQITNFQLNGQACDYVVDANGWVSVTDDQAQATNPVGNIWTFTFTFNGKNYKVVVE